MFTQRVNLPFRRSYTGRERNLHFFQKESTDLVCFKSNGDETGAIVISLAAFDSRNGLARSDIGIM